MPMAKMKKYPDGVRKSIFTSEALWNEAQQAEPNLSDYLTEKLRELVEAKNKAAEMRSELIKVEEEAKQLEPKKDEVEKKREGLQAALQAYDRPDGAMTLAQNEQYSEAIERIKDARTPMGAIAIAKARAKILQELGMEITPEELLAKADNMKAGQNKMYG